MSDDEAPMGEHSPSRFRVLCVRRAGVDTRRQRRHLPRTVGGPFVTPQGRGRDLPLILACVTPSGLIVLAVLVYDVSMVVSR